MTAAAGADPHRPPPAVLGAALLVATGAVAACVLSVAAPVESGLRRASAPSTLLATFDVLFLLALAWPRRGDVRDRATSGLLVLAAGAPFHAALAGAAGGAGGHAAAVMLIALAAAAAGAVAGARRPYPALLAVALLGLPLAGYGITDFSGPDALWMVSAAPSTALVGFARGAAGTVASDAVPAVAALLAVALLSCGRLPGRTGSTTLVVLALALPAAAADVTPLFGGVVRPGRPVTVRAPGADRVRADGGVWALPVGSRADEFVLVGATVAGETLRVEVERGGALTTVDVPVRPRTEERLVARLAAGEPVAGEVTVGTDTLPTTREAWLVFDAVGEVPPALPAAEGAAVRAFAEDGPRAFPFEPLLLPAGADVYRATAAAALRAPRIQAATARVLLVVAVLELLLLALLRRRATATRAGVALVVLAPLVATTWLALSDALPGPVRATALVLDGADDTLVLLRLTRTTPSAVTVEAPPGAGALAALRWDAGDAAPAVAGVGRRAEVDLTEARIAVLAYRVPRSASTSGDGAGVDAAWIEPLRAWVKRHGLGLEGGGDVDTGILPRIAGAPVFAAGRGSVAAP